MKFNLFFYLLVIPTFLAFGQESKEEKSPTVKFLLKRGYIYPDSIPADPNDQNKSRETYVVL